MTPENWRRQSDEKVSSIFMPQISTLCYPPPPSQQELSCRQAAALLQLLNAMAGGRDVGTAVTITCQTIIKGTGLGSRAPLVKRLAYNIVKGAALTDSDWDNVLSGFQNDISPASPSTEVLLQP